MKSTEIREKFFNFFSGKGHEIVPSAPIVVKNDPTLMFINAGMNQFKDVFLGNVTPEQKRVANTQKCLRVSGKHNDLEEVGVDTYHHTMFEMLGNWSFGDYFKEEAINWAFELLTEVYHIDKSRIYVTYFGGDKNDNLDPDNEAAELWKKHMPEDRILAFGKKDNFWEMGEIGPCGPSSEIHVDVRDEEERKKTDGKDLVNQDHPQVIEIWNLVFIQYQRSLKSGLTPLPEKHVDTGMGFERLAMVLQGKRSNYDTDVFAPLIEKIETISGVSYKASDSKQDVAIRVVADHVRAVSFAICDGQLPSNTGAGYVIRRILRRAVRYGYSFLNLSTPFLHQIVPVLNEQLSKVFPELAKQKDFIEKVILEEETNFLKTLDRGIQRFEQYMSKHDAEKLEKIDGNFAFELYDTFGFPIDLTQLMAKEYNENLSVDLKVYEQALSQQKDRSRKATEINSEDWVEVEEDLVEEFIGYDRLETEVKITRYRKIEIKGKQQYHLVFNITPFYPEGGGQVGDTGYIEANGKKISIVDTQKENNLIIHTSTELPDEVTVNFKAVVNESKRRATEKNHSVTHLLHHALREELGTHVEQKGSLVHPDYLRFDFSHFQKVENDQLEIIESKVKAMIEQNAPLEEFRDVPFNEAEKMGAMSLFGEKYGDLVRVIKFGDSLEFCGGTHIQSTGQIGNFKIVSEGSVAAGIRRIEAISSRKADEFIQSKLNALSQISDLLKSPKDMVKAVKDLQDQNNKLRKELEESNVYKIDSIGDKVMSQMSEQNGIQLFASSVAYDAETIKNVSWQLDKKKDNLVVIAGGINNGKVHLTVFISKQLAENKGLNAVEVISAVSSEIKGGGGGQPFFATAGGKNPDGLESAINKAKEMILQAV